MALWKRKKPLRLEVDEVGVRRRRGDAIVEEVAWDSLAALSMVTTDEGPFVEDVFFILKGPDGTGVAVPSGQAPAGFLERLQQLPGSTVKPLSRPA